MMDASVFSPYPKEHDVAMELAELAMILSKRYCSNTWELKYLVEKYADPDPQSRLGITVPKDEQWWAQEHTREEIQCTVNVWVEELFQMALEQETKAAESIGAGNEPLRGILFRSAATLAMDCRKYEQAKNLAETGLDSDQLREHPQIEAELMTLKASAARRTTQPNR